MEFKIYRAKRSDLMDVYKLSNDPVVRKNSFNQHNIIMKEHLKWFNDKICGENCIFYIIRDEKSNLIGQVRFDVLPQKIGEYLVNISLSSEYRGKGLGYRILKRVSNNLVKDFKVKKISADVKASNIASIKSFEKAGYKIKYKQVEDGIEVFKFEYLNKRNKLYGFSHS